MKRPIEKYLKNPMLIIFLIVLIFFTPQALFSPGQNRDKGVVIGVGIDRVQDEFEISLLTFIPTVKQSFEQMNSVISGKGDTLAKALYNAQIAMGRNAGLSHAKTTVVNQELMQEDVAKYIDYLSRVASLSENTVFICTDRTAKEFLQASTSLVSSVGLQLEQVIGYNAKNLYVTDTSLEAFYKGYYSNANSSLIGFLSIEESTQSSQGEEAASSESKSGANDISSNGGDTNSLNSVSEGGGSGSSSGGGGSSSGSTSSEKKGGKILNEGKAVLIKGGKLMEVLSVDELNGINLLNIESVNQIITIKDDSFGGECKLSYRIKNKRINTVTHFENGCPVYASQLILGLELTEIEGDHNKKVNTEFSDINPSIRKKIDEQLKNQFTKALSTLRKNHSDVIGINEEFFTKNRKQYLKFIEEIGGADNFLDYVNFKLNFIIESD